ncbi:beta-galactosidase small subunit [Lentzea guizhouensis]|uniref:beta-galactosidase small subunit n=1 Tax=Lentzea guizhouensis TaxID=1586287 RepID=UPI000B0DFF5A|nr:beta-galactosidase small subunit [Lentzea guizhouensis]
MLRLGPGEFSPVTGQLTRLGPFALDGPGSTSGAPDGQRPRRRLASDERAWRAGPAPAAAPVVSVEADAYSLLVRTRVAPPALGFGMHATYLWTASGDRVRLELDVTPDGEWPCPLPRLGLRLAVPGSLDAVSWFGLGPGEAYADSRQAVRVGRFSSTVDGLQTPYVFPQENGNRADARWLELSDGVRRLRVEGSPVFDFAARRWTSEDLDAATHTDELRARDRVFLNLDLAQHGLGTASCGPGVLPQYRLPAGKASFALTFTAS